MIVAFGVAFEFPRAARVPAARPGASTPRQLRHVRRWAVVGIVDRSRRSSPRARTRSPIVHGRPHVHLLRGLDRDRAGAETMSPSRARGGRSHRRRSRRELCTAVGGAVAVVVGHRAAHLAAAARARRASQGTGGLANRQPRAPLARRARARSRWSRSRGGRLRRQRAAGSGTGRASSCSVGWLILVAARCSAGILWPGGLLRHPTPCPPPTADADDIAPTDARRRSGDDRADDRRARPRPSRTTPTTGGP